MEKRYLIPAVDKWKWLMSICIDGKGLVQLYSQHVNLLTQPIKIGQFIACDEDGNVLEEPLHYFEWATRTLGTDLTEQEIYANQDAKLEYQEAQSRVIFSNLIIEINELGYKDIYSVFIKDDVSKRFLWTIDNQNGFKIVNSKATTLEDLTRLNLELTDNALKG